MPRFTNMDFFCCAATEAELAALPSSLAIARHVTGVGIPETFARLLPLLLKAKTETVLLNIGIAGAYPNTGLAIGDIVIANGEIYGDVGMELPPQRDVEPTGFLPLSETPFGGPLYATPLPTLSLPDFLALFFPYSTALSVDDFPFAVRTGRGCTVNTCTGTAAVGQRREQQFAARFETMEGAAVAQLGQMFSIPVCEIRAISNIAAERAMRLENIHLALANLTSFLEAVALRAGNRQ